MQNESCSDVATLLDEHPHLAKKKSTLKKNMFLKENKVFIPFFFFFFTYEILAKCTLFEQKIVGHLKIICINFPQNQNYIKNDYLNDFF